MPGRLSVLLTQFFMFLWVLSNVAVAPGPLFAPADQGRVWADTNLHATRTRTDASTGLSAALGHARFEQIQTLVPDAGSQCLPVTGATAKTAKYRNMELLDLLSRIEASPMGAWLITQAQRRGVLLCLDRNTEFKAYFRSQARLIGVQDSLSAAAKIAYLAHELAHVIQHPRYSNNRYFSPSDMALIQRHREAVAEAFATCVLAQLKHLGDVGPWEAKKRTHYRDIVMAYEQELTLTPARTASAQQDRELRAMRAAFTQWFQAPWRIEFYDGLMLDHLERIAKDAIGLLPTRRVADEAFLSGIAWHNGKSFLSESEAILTGAPYAVPFSSENRARLDRILDLAAIRTHSGPIP